MSNLDAGAIQEVEKLTRAAAPILYPNGEQKGVYLLRQPDGSYERERAELDPQDATVFDLESAVSLENLGAAEAAWVKDDSLILAYQNEHLRWRVNLALPTHPAFSVLESFRRLTPLSQKALVRLLRTELNEYVDATVISMFSVLKFKSTDQGTSTVRPASAGLDRSIQQRVQAENGGDMPETISFRVPVYDIPEARDDRYPVKVYVEFDHEEQVFQLITVHNDLRAAQEQAVRRVIAHLKDKMSVPVYYGKPS